MKLIQFPFLFTAQNQFEFFSTSRTFIVPNGVTKIYVTCVPAGGGGGGGGAGSNRWGNNGGSPGGGGGYANNIIRQSVSVVAGQLYTITVGAGGSGGGGGVDYYWNGGGSGGNGTDGGVTTITHTTFGTVFSASGGGFGYGGYGGGFGGSGSGGGWGGSLGGVTQGPGGLNPNVLPAPFTVVSRGGNGGGRYNAGTSGSNAQLMIEWGF